MRRQRRLACRRCRTVSRGRSRCRGRREPRPLPRPRLRPRSSAPRRRPSRRQRAAAEAEAAPEAEAAAEATRTEAEAPASTERFVEGRYGLVVPPFVGLTGGIGAGKSTALAAFERLGAAVISTDAIVHELYRTDRGARCGGGALWCRGRAQRRRRSRCARGTGFADSADRVWLEQLLWPLVRGRVSAWREQMLRTEPPPRVLVAEVPLLFEAGSEDMYDATIAVIADEQVRDARAAARAGTGPWWSATPGSSARRKKPHAPGLSLSMTAASRNSSRSCRRSLRCWRHEGGGH